MITYPNLPIVALKNDIIDALKTHQVLIVAGDTGSGKSTQLPKFCLEAGLVENGIIAHTQPRRIAAKAIATQVAKELNSTVGEMVGVKIRFLDKVNPETKIKVLTDGMLLQELASSRNLAQYSAIIIDEAHERSLNIDILLGMLQKLLRKRQDLRVIITSATIAHNRFLQFFNQAKMFEVEGRTYPITVKYLTNALEQFPSDPTMQAVMGVKEAVRCGPGDILVFQTGEREIKELCAELNKIYAHQIDVLPLYARLSITKQQAVFKPSKRRKIIVATNVAETSITVPNIVYVVDNGLARVNRYSYRNKLSRLPIEPIAQANATQRKGRCGRVAPGTCIRLYAEEALLSRAEFLEPEILRANLAGVILRLSYLGVKDITRFPLLDRPDPKLLRDGYKLLEMLGAIENQRLISIGKLMAKLPLEPRLARIVLAAEKFHALKECLMIISGLSISQVWHDKPPKDHAQSDFMCYVLVFTSIRKHKAKLSHKQFKAWCDEQGLSLVRVLEWLDIYQQLITIVADYKLRINQQEATLEQVHQALLSGFLDNIGLKTKDKDFQGARVKFLVHPRSQVKANLSWVMGAELIHTSKVFLSCVAQIQPDWIVKVAPKSLVKHQYMEPYWCDKTGRIKVYESLWLYGLPIQGKRRVNYEAVSPKTCRQIFIHEGLIKKNDLIQFGFYRHNQNILDAARMNEAKLRGKRFLVQNEKLSAFYQITLDPSIVSLPTLNAWIQTHGDKSLYLQQDNQFVDDLTKAENQDYPDQVVLQQQPIQLRYMFDLDSDQDGVTFCVPQELVGHFQAKDFSYLVPGLIADKIELALRALDKANRRKLIPFEATLQRVVQDMQQGAQQDFAMDLSKYLKQHYGISISSSFFQSLDLPPYLKPHFKILLKGTQNFCSDDWNDIQTKFKNSVVLEQPQSATIVSKDFEFNNLDESQIVLINGRNITQYIGLAKVEEGVQKKLFSTKRDADISHYHAILWLLVNKLEVYSKKILKQCSYKKNLQKAFAHFCHQEDPWQFVFINVIKHTYKLDVTFCSTIRSQEAFSTLVSQGTSIYITNTTKLLSTLKIIFELAQKIFTVLGPLEQRCTFLKENILDIKRQLKNLLFDLFIVETPYEWVLRFPIYLQAIIYRIDKLSQRSDKDLSLLKQVNIFEKKLAQKNKQVEDNWAQHSATTELRWLLEEYRVSLFAQHLKTKIPVSKSRLVKSLEKLNSS